jgi:hypothetical protein
MKYNISYGNHGNYKFILNHKFRVTIWVLKVCT